MVGKSVRAFVAVGVALSGWAITSVSAQSVAVGVTTETITKPMAVTVNATGVLLKVLLEQIAEQAGLHAVYGDRVAKSVLRVTMRAHNVSAKDAFEAALAGTGLKAVLGVDKVFFTDADIAGATAAQGRIEGTVFDAHTKRPIRRATVTVDGVSPGVTTDDNGRFHVPTVSPGVHTVNVRVLGYIKAAKTATVIEGQMASIEFGLEPSINALDQVVVTGTVVAAAQRTIPNAMTIITAKDLEQRGITHIDQLFRGDVPGVFAMNGGSSFTLDQVTMFSRGASTLSNSPYLAATSTIKTYVDGIELADPQYLSQIDARSIERIEILTGPQASTIYGSNAINGVMQIFTKRGSTSRPQLTANVLSGVVQNSFRPSLTPVHTMDARLSGIDGRWSYQAGGAWDYMGPWTPAKQMTRLNGDGGVRVDAGSVTADVSLRFVQTKNRATGIADQSWITRSGSGQYIGNNRGGNTVQTTSILQGQTRGLTLGYAPTSWWSHELVVGTDVSDVEALSTRAGFWAPNDTNLTLTQTQTSRTSFRYATTIQIPLTSMTRAVVSVGLDQWRSLSTSMSAQGQSLTGTVSPLNSPSRLPSHNAGAFFQGQLGIGDGLFLTSGVRAEWNPNFGNDVSASLAPRYGVAYTRDVGPITAKLRASYGRSTRPPTSAEQQSASISANAVPYYGDVLTQLTSPDLGPEFQQGGEGGLELYWGTRGALVVTRYNQTVDGVIVRAKVDSARSFTQSVGSYQVMGADGYYYFYVNQYLNLGSVRNQGWELQGTVNAGPFTTRGTYSWTKSRVLGITPAYRSAVTGTGYLPGASFNFLPEHTWALSTTYAHAATAVTLAVNGISQLYSISNDLVVATNSQIRLYANRPRIGLPSNFLHLNGGYAMADLNATQRFSSRIEGVLQVQNLTNFYQSDYDPTTYPVLGRQTKAGLRIRW